MPQLGEHHFGGAQHRSLYLFVAFGYVDACKGRAVDAAALLCGDLRSEQHVLVFGEFFGCQTVVESGLYVDEFGRALVLKVVKYALVDGYAQAALFVQRGEGRPEFVPVVENALRVGIELVGFRVVVFEL